jgi:polyferredoxin
MHRTRFSVRAVLPLLILVASGVLLVSGQLWAQVEQPRGKMGFWDILLLPRVWVGAMFCLVGAVALARARTIRTVRKVALPVIFFTFGVLSVLPLGWFARGMGMHPSPVCTVTKPLLFLNAGREVPIVFAGVLFSIAVFSVAGNKLFCGWVCPVGALQELMHEIPLAKRFKVRLPFRVTNGIRVAAFVLFVPLVFVVGRSIFDYINPFHALHWTFAAYEMFVLVVVMVAALFIFRPFCYLLCPLGLFTWILERISIARIQVDTERCVTCYNCIEEAPCPAIGAILDGKRTAPDCHSCGKCLDICSENAIRFSGRNIFRKAKRMQEG